MSKITMYDLVLPKRLLKLFSKGIRASDIGVAIGVEKLDSPHPVLVVRNVITEKIIKKRPSRFIKLIRQEAENSEIILNDIVIPRTKNDNWTIGKVIRTSRHELDIGPLLEIQDIKTNEIVKFFPMHVFKLERAAK